MEPVYASEGWVALEALFMKTNAGCVLLELRDYRNQDPAFSRKKLRLVNKLRENKGEYGKQIGICREPRAIWMSVNLAD